MTKVGNNIKKIRATKGLSQQAFADLFELTRGNISSYEENRAEPRIETIVKIANYFSIPLEAFIREPLTVNQILNFKGDKLMEEEKTLDNLQIKEVPFLNGNIFLQCLHGNITFTDTSRFPKLALPASTKLELLAINFNTNIPHPVDLPKYAEHDVLIFEEVTADNFHLCVDSIGLFLGTTEIVIGHFRTLKNKGMALVLNELKSFPFEVAKEHRYWKLHAIYIHHSK
jgi:transcriptional regulator with XRE-family HTH domain